MTERPSEPSLPLTVQRAVLRTIKHAIPDFEDYQSVAGNRYFLPDDAPDSGLVTKLFTTFTDTMTRLYELGCGYASPVVTSQSSQNPNYALAELLRAFYRSPLMLRLPLRAQVLLKDPRKPPPRRAQDMQYPSLARREMLPDLRRWLSYLGERVTFLEKALGPLPRERASRVTAEKAVEAYLKTHPNATISNAAKAGGCSRGLVSDMVCWKHHLAAKIKRRFTKACPKALPNSEECLANLTDAERDAWVLRLTSEQKADHEDSSAEKHGRSPRVRKQV